MEVDLGKSSAVAVLIAALSSGGTYMGTRTEVASEDRCVELARVQRQADIEDVKAALRRPHCDLRAVHEDAPGPLSAYFLTKITRDTSASCSEHFDRRRTTSSRSQVSTAASFIS